jgi:hypothetical protein
VALEAAIKNGVTVAEVTYSNSISVSEHVVMMILSLVRIRGLRFTLLGSRSLDHVTYPMLPRGGVIPVRRKQNGSS